MKNVILIALILLGTLTSNAQEQPGIVKTIGRPDQPGRPLEDVLLQAQDNPNTSKSDNTGSFRLLLANYKQGQAYSLSRVTKLGYQLADNGVIGRQYPYSDEIPLEITMISNEDYRRLKLEIEDKIRTRVESEFAKKLEDISRQLKEKIISEEEHIQKICELSEYYDKSSNLIEELADRYARTDYDRLDSIDVRINSLIELGMLDEAEQLILSKGTKKTLEQLRKDNTILSKTLEEGKRAEARMVLNYSSELYMQYEIASMRFDNFTAAEFLKERMELDTSNINWKMDYAAFICEYLGKYDEAKKLYNELLASSSDMPVLAEIYNCLGTIYHQQGQYDSALSSFKISAELREGDSLYRNSLANNYLNLSAVYLTINNYAEANFYLQLAEAIFKEYDDTLGLADVYNKHAIRLYDEGELNKAEEMLTESISLKQELLGDNNLRIASEYISYAILMGELGRFKEAVEYAEKVIAIRSRILGENHPAVADAYQVYASTKMKMGEYDSVLSYYEKALDIFIRFYGNIHPEIASIYNNLGHYNNVVTSDFHKVKEYYSMALEMNRQLYGEHHSSIANGLNNLAAAHGNLAEYDTALDLYNQALEIWVALYGTNHLSVGDIYNNYASIYYKLGQYEQAIIYQEKSLVIYREVYGETHHAVGLGYDNIGSIYMALGEDQKALDYLGKAVSIYQDVYGESHLSTARVYDKIGQLYYNHNMYDQAESIMSEALNIRISHCGDNHIDVASSYNNIGQIYLSRGEYEKAEELFTKCLQIKKKLLEDRHPDIATALSNFAVLYYKQKNYIKAVEYNLQALDILQQCLPQEHPILMTYRYGVAENYYRSGEYNKALPYLNIVYNDSLEKRGPDDKNTNHYFMFMNTLYFEIMNSEDYDESLDDEYRSFNENTIIVASVEENTLASDMGLNGDYYVMSYEDWKIWQDDVNFFVYHMSISSIPNKTYVLYRDGEYTVVPFEGKLGVRLAAKWIPREEKLKLMKNYKKRKRNISGRNYYHCTWNK